MRADAVTDKAVAAARAKAAEVAAAAKAGTPLAAAAKAAGKDVRTTELIARNSVVADIGVSPAVDAVAFALPVGATSDVIATENGAAVVKVLEKAGDQRHRAGRRPRLAAPRAGVDAPEPVLHRLHEQGEDVADDQPLPGRHRPRVTAVAGGQRTGRPDACACRASRVGGRGVARRGGSPSAS